MGIIVFFLYLFSSLAIVSAAVTGINAWTISFLIVTVVFSLLAAVHELL